MVRDIIPVTKSGRRHHLVAKSGLLGTPNSHRPSLGMDGRLGEKEADEGSSELCSTCFTI